MSEYIIGKGALPAKTDVRDYRVKATSGDFPETFELNYLPKVKNQHAVNSCVAHATSSILEYFNKKEVNSTVELSTNFIYGMQGVALGRYDSGMYLRDACKIVKEYGDPTEDTIKGNTEQPNCAKRLSEQLTDEVYAEAAIGKIDSYARCRTEKEIKHALMNYGPVLASIKWYDDSIITHDGVIIMNTEADYGYHAIMIYGWNKKGWLCQNSWGSTWGNCGRFIYPFNNTYLSEKIEEAWLFVDAKNSDIYAPKRNKGFDFFYSIINFILNLFKGRE